MAYETLGDIYGNQRLGAFDGPLGDVASAQRDYDNATRELQSAQASLGRIGNEVNQAIQCSAIPNSPMMPKIACPTTAGAASSQLSAAGKRVQDAQNTVNATKAALDSEKSAVATGEVLRGVGTILAPLAQAGAGIYQAQSQAALEKARLKAQQSGLPLPSFMMPPTPAKKSSLPLIIGGVAVVGVIGAVLLLSGGEAKTKSRR